MKHILAKTMLNTLALYKNKAIMPFKIVAGILAIIVLGGFLMPVAGQELQCRVQVRHNQIQGTQKQLYQSMQKDIYEFMNNRKWTEHVYANNERIECNIQVNLTKRIGSEKFVGTVQVQSRRPVYNATYTTVMLNYQEKKNNFEFLA